MAATQAASVPLTVRETGGVDRVGWPVTCGVPFADEQVKAEAIAAGGYRLVDAAGQEVPCQAEVAATWGVYPTGSNGFAKWIHLTFLADVAAGQTAKYQLEYGQGIRNKTGSGLKVSEKAQCVTVTTGKGAGALRLLISRERCNILNEVALDVDGNGFGKDDVILSSRDAANLWVGYDHNTARVNTSRPEVVVEQAGPVMAVIRVKTKLDSRFESVVRIFTYANSPLVRIQETLVHGPTGQNRSAGQPQPVVMKSHVLELPIRTNAGEAVATVGTGEALPEPAQFRRESAWLADGVTVSLEQDLVHPCKPGNIDENRLSKAFNYSVHADSKQIAAGQRSPGWIDVSDRRWGVTAAVRYFWQSFPKRLVATAKTLRLEHWAEGAQLNPLARNYNWMGMAKTHDTMLYFHKGDAGTARAEQVALGHIHELFATCEPAYYCMTRAYGRQMITPAVQDGRQVHPEYDAMVAGGLNRERKINAGFYYFRETEDDYGYFNFGDFLVGPYWGQLEYDPAYCMIQQFYRTGELKYLEFSAECARHNYDIDFTHTYTPESSNYPQREHDKRGSHFAGEDSHGQWNTNTDPGHVFIAGLANYWYLTGDPRAKDVIGWSLPVYLGEDWYRMGGGGTWRYLGGYLLTVMTYAYELTWDNRYIEPMLWAAREYMVNGHTRHEDGIWWSTEPVVPERPGDTHRAGRRPREDWASMSIAYALSTDAQVAEQKQYFCQTWLADSITNGYTQALEIYPGSPCRKAIESAVVNLADFLLKHGLTEDFDGVRVGVRKPTTESSAYAPEGVYAHSMPNMVILTLAKAYHYTGDTKYADAARKLISKACEHKDDLSALKPVTQGTYYPPMVLPYLDGTIPPRAKDANLVEVAPANVWLEHSRQILKAAKDRSGTIFVGDQMATACAPEDRRGRAWGNEAGWHLSNVLGSIEGLLARHKPRYVVIMLGSSELPLGHPERTDFEANYQTLVRKIVAAGSIPVCTTLPPCSHLEGFAWMYNTEMYQVSKLYRVPVIDVHELMKGQGPKVVNGGEAESKVPPAEWSASNTFAAGHEKIVQAELNRIVAQIESRPKPQ